MTRLALAALLAFSINTHADTDVSIGVGMPFGGFFGGNISYSINKFDLYGGAGLLSYANDKANIGWSFGFDVPFSNRHKAGISYGTVSSSSFETGGYEETFIYKGVALNYRYHFVGSHKSGWFIGGSAYSGSPNKDSDLIDDSSNGVSILAGFQF